MASSKLATEVSKTVPPADTSAPATAPVAIAKPAAKTAKKVAAKPVAVKPVATKKVVVAPKAAKVAVAKESIIAKEKKIKMVRDSISIPKTEFLVLGEMKTRAGKLGVEVKKTELIRAGIKVLTALTGTAFVAAIRAVPNIKTGRPTKAG
ncbi:MAG: hypothetical protein WCK00_09320 [Deltaproteobacteria bacterium]